MSSEVLSISVLNANGADGKQSSLPEVLKTFPQVRVWGAAGSPEEFLSRRPEETPDLVVVDLGHADALPEWLVRLTLSQPELGLMVCSHNREPGFLIKVIQLGVKEFVPLPLDRSDLEAALDRLQRAKKRRATSENKGGRLIAVTGLKGGIGTTAIAVNLAVSLAEFYPAAVALVDLGRPFPDVAKFLDQSRQTGLHDLAEHADYLDASLVLKTLQPHASNLAVLHGSPNFKDLEMMNPQVLRKLWTTLRGLFEWVVIDLSHWLDDLYQEVIQEADQVLLLTELMVPHLENLKKWLATYDHWGLERSKLKVVVNRYQKANGVGLADIERLVKAPPFFTLPSDFPALSESINHGVPLKELAPRSKLCRGFQRLASELAETANFVPLEPHAQAKSRRRFLFF